MTSERRPFGASSLSVFPVGLGAGPLGDASLAEADVARLLHGALDLGVNVIDTAPSYGASEERLGRVLEARRHDVVLSTKGGYGVPGTPDWTPAVVERGIDASLRRLRTDVIDVYHLHSCPRDVLAQEGLLEALDRAREKGKIRIGAYSGENDALAYAAESPLVGGLQCSVNPFDQGSLRTVLPRAQERGLGVLAKRALANAPWRWEQRPTGHYAEEYWSRMKAMDLDPSPLGWVELAARFAAFAPGVSAILVGTTQLAHLEEITRLVQRGPLPSSTVHAVRAAFDAARNDGWVGQI